MARFSAQAVTAIIGQVQSLTTTPVTCSSAATTPVCTTAYVQTVLVFVALRIKTLPPHTAGISGFEIFYDENQRKN